MIAVLQKRSDYWWDITLYHVFTPSVSVEVSTVEQVLSEVPQELNKLRALGEDFETRHRSSPRDDARMRPQVAVFLQENANVRVIAHLECQRLKTGCDLVPGLPSELETDLRSFFHTYGYDLVTEEFRRKEPPAFTYRRNYDIRNLSKG